jgi:hypothetical protein
MQTGRFRAVLVALATLAGCVVSSGVDTDDPTAIAIDPPDGTTLYQPTSLSFSTSIRVHWSFTVVGGTLTGMPDYQITGPSCSGVLAPVAEGQTTPGTVALSISSTPSVDNYLGADAKVTYHFVAGTPTFSPAAGNLALGDTVTIASVSTGAAIHYTTDGSLPTAASALYTAPFELDKSVTVRAIALGGGYVDSGVGSAVYTVATFTDLCADWNAAIAARTVACLLADADYLAGRAGAIDCATLQADIQAGQTTVDATRTVACTEALQALPCAALVSSAPGPFAFPMSGTACAGVIVGTGATSADCRRNSQCASGYCTSTTIYSCPGTCQPRNVAGGKCTRGSECAEGLACSSTTHKCAAYAALDDPCNMDDDCAPDLRCLDFTCKPPLASGAGCSASFNCTVADVCIDGTCQALVGLGGTCTQPMAPGMPTVCAAGFWCNAGTCAALPKVGGTCTDIWACTGGYCDMANNGGTCKAYLGTGESCTSSSQCASQIQSFDKCVALGDFYCAPP